MFERITEFVVVPSRTGQSYRPCVYGRLRPDRMWEAFLVFFPVGSGRVNSTPLQTVENSYFALESWARSLGRVYIEQSLEHALHATAGVALATSAPDIDAAELAAAADAVALHRAAERAIAAASEAAVAEMHEDTAAAAREQSGELRREQVNKADLIRELRALGRFDR